jgi:hypothetical protein
MGDRRHQDRTRVLDEVGEAVAGYLAALDAYEQKYRTALAGPAGPCPPEPVPFDRTGWDDQLATARARAEEVERLVREQEALWTRWRDAVADWRRAIEQPGREEVSQPHP